MNKIVILPFSMVLVCYSHFSFAYKTPPFSGKWYSSAEVEFKEPDACQENFFSEISFENLTSSSEQTAKLVAYDDIYRVYGVYPTQCSVIAEKDYSNSSPLTFPNKLLWSLTVSTTSNPKVKSVTLSCVLPDSTEIKVKEIRVEPHYENCKDSCLDACFADIAGRDLDISIFKDIGHVGLGFSEIRLGKFHYFTLEVLNESQVIQINTLNDFKNKTHYWGNSFGNPNISENLSWLDSCEVMDAAIFQMYFCSEYSLIPGNSRPAGPKPQMVLNEKNNTWEQQLGIACSIFRCDTFVNYAYSKANIKIPTSNYVLPVLSFKSLPHRRNENLILNLPATYYEEINEPINSEDNVIYAIEKAKMGKDSNFLINAIEKMNEDKALSPKQRSNVLLNFFDKSKGDTEIMRLLTDTLISPNYDLSNKINEINYLIETTDDVKIKSHLLRGLATTYSNYIAGQTDVQSIENAKLIQNIFKRHLESSDELIQVTLLKYINTIFPVNEAKELLNRYSFKSEASINSQLVKTKANLAIVYLQNDINNWNDFWDKIHTAEEKANYLFHIAVYISHPNIFDNLSPQQKELLREIFIENWPENFDNGSPIWIYNMHNWLKAFSMVSISNNLDPTDNIICALSRHKNTDEVALFLNYLSPKFGNLSNNSCFNEIKQKLLYN